eukprot:UN03268
MKNNCLKPSNFPKVSNDSCISFACRLKPPPDFSDSAASKISPTVAESQRKHFVYFIGTK